MLPTKRQSRFKKEVGDGLVPAKRYFEATGRSRPAPFIHPGFRCSPCGFPIKLSPMIARVRLDLALGRV
jgi:hypothetical protein